MKAWLNVLRIPKVKGFYRNGFQCENYSYPKQKPRSEERGLLAYEKLTAKIFHEKV